MDEYPQTIDFGFYGTPKSSIQCFFNSILNNGFIDVTKNSSWGNDGRINLNNVALKLGIFF